MLHNVQTFLTSAGHWHSNSHLWAIYGHTNITGRISWFPLECHLMCNIMQQTKRWEYI